MVAARAFFAGFGGVKEVDGFEGGVFGVEFGPEFFGVGGGPAFGDAVHTFGGFHIKKVNGFVLGGQTPDAQVAVGVAARKAFGDDGDGVGGVVEVEGEGAERGVGVGGGGVFELAVGAGDEAEAGFGVGSARGAARAAVDDDFGELVAGEVGVFGVEGLGGGFGVAVFDLAFELGEGGAGEAEITVGEEEELLAVEGFEADFGPEVVLGDGDGEILLVDLGGEWVLALVDGQLGASQTEIFFGEGEGLSGFELHAEAAL